MHQNSSQVFKYPGLFLKQYNAIHTCINTDHIDEHKNIKYNITYQSKTGQSTSDSPLVTLQCTQMRLPIASSTIWWQHQRTNADILPSNK